MSWPTCSDDTWKLYFINRYILHSLPKKYMYENTKFDVILISFLHVKLLAGTYRIVTTSDTQKMLLRGIWVYLEKTTSWRLRIPMRKQDSIWHNPSKKWEIERDRRTLNLLWKFTAIERAFMIRRLIYWSRNFDKIRNCSMVWQYGLSCELNNAGS